MKKRSRCYPRVQVDTSDVPAVGQAGAVQLTETLRVSGLDAQMSAALAPWRKPLAIHDPGKVVLDSSPNALLQVRSRRLLRTSRAPAAVEGRRVTCATRRSSGLRSQADCTRLFAA